MTQEAITEQDIGELVERVTRAAKAYIRGDMRTYFDLMKHTNDEYTLLSPFGGEPARGFDTSPERIEALAKFFRSGDAEVEVVETYASGDLVVLVLVERQHGVVGDLPDRRRLEAVLGETPGRGAQDQIATVDRLPVGLVSSRPARLRLGIVRPRPKRVLP